jgi:hypothetical protein
MSNLELFLLGVAVTLLTAAALAPLIWAAIQDGRYNDQQQQFYREQALRAESAAASAEAAGVSHAT